MESYTLESLGPASWTQHRLFLRSLAVWPESAPHFVYGGRIFHCKTPSRSVSQLIRWWTLGSCPPFANSKSCCCEHVPTSFGGHVSSLLLRCTQISLAGSDVLNIRHLQELPDFSKQLLPFTFPPAMDEGPHFPTSSATAVSIWLFFFFGFFCIWLFFNRDVSGCERTACGFELLWLL